MERLELDQPRSHPALEEFTLTPQYLLLPFHSLVLELQEQGQLQSLPAVEAFIPTQL